MDQDVVKRIEALEAQMKALQSEVHALKQPIKGEEKQVKHVIQPTQPTIEKKPIPEKPLTKIFFPNATTVDAAGQVKTASEKKEEKEQLPKKSFEERFLNFLPKIFMVILVLGVLWGLKLASDYGYLADSIKVLGGYALAVLLGAAALYLESKRKTTDTLIISLYGGSFIVGILTTAAGAVILDVLHLSVALLLALVFIAYGVVISYFKRSEVLTIFVAFTSLLLPYLLEYMAFDQRIIAGYVIVLFAVIQFVIIKYKQKWALYIATFFSLIAPVALVNGDGSMYPSLSFALIVVLAIFYYTWWKICEEHASLKGLHLALIFSFSMYTLFSLFVIWDLDGIPLYMSGVLALVQIGMLYAAYARKKQELLDVMASAILLTILAGLLGFNISEQSRMLLMLVAAFVGLMVGLKLRVAFTKFINGFVFLLLGMITYIAFNFNVFISMNHLLLVLVPVGLYSAYLYAKREKEALNWYENIMEKTHFVEFVPVAVFFFIWAYIWKLDRHFNVGVPIGDLYTYYIVADLLLAFLFVAGFTVGKKWVGPFLPPIAAFFFIAKSLLIMSNPHSHSGEFMDIFVIRLVYVVLTIFVLLDLWKKGLIYRNFAKWIEPAKHWIVVGAIIWMIFYVFGTTDLLHVYKHISWNVAVMLNTLMIFVSAVVAMVLGRKYTWKQVTVFGILLLCFGFIKMIFFDLSNLDLFVRSILFMIVGGVGLAVSSRFMKK